MADKKQIKNALANYKTIVKACNELNLNFKQEDDEMTVSFGMHNGNQNDVNMQFEFKCDVERQLLSVMSILPFQVPDDKKTTIAVLTCCVNYKLAEGCFDFSMNDGVILFRYTANFGESLLSTELIKRALRLCVYTVDEYNDKLRDVAEGKMDIDEFLKAISN